MGRGRGFRWRRRGDGRSGRNLEEVGVLGRPSDVGGLAEGIGVFCVFVIVVIRDFGSCACLHALLAFSGTGIMVSNSFFVAFVA